MAGVAARPLGALLVCALAGLAPSCSGGGAHPIQLRSVEPQADGGTGGGAGAPAAGGGTPWEDETGGSTGGAVEPTGGRPETGGSAGAPGAGGTPSTGGAGYAGTEETGGSTGTGRCPIVPNEYGSVEPGTNECGIRGDWYTYNDYGDCIQVGLTDCIDNQLPEEGKFPNEGGRMCTSGDTSVPASDAERKHKWGAGIGLKLNIDGGEKPISELPRTIVGFTFTVSPSNPSNPQDVPEGLRVNFPTPPTFRNEHYVDLVDPVAGLHQVHIADAKAPLWGDPAAFDSSQVTAIQFYVPTITGESVHFDFCIENLTALYLESLPY